ncbi:general substrate transporter [Aspergillus heterothallicus]
MSPISPDHDWRVVRPDLKWQILRRQWRFMLWALYTSIGSMMMGYDFGVAGTCTAIPAFVEYFGYPFEDRYLIPARSQSGWSGAATAGHVIGAIAGGFLMDIIGRKHTMLLGSVLTAAGIGMQQGAHEWRLFLAGRLISGFPRIWHVFVNSPVWIGEVVRPELRGFFLCIMNGSIVLGQRVLACVAQGVSTISTDWSWKIVIILQYMFVSNTPEVPLIAFYPLFPESPYYLLKKNNVDRARHSLAKIHGKEDHDLIDAEIERIQANVDFSEEVLVEARLKGPLVVQAFKGTNRKRSLIAMLSPAGQQMIGSAFVLQYITYFLDLIGVENYFLVSLILYIVMLLSNLSAFFVVEIAGRRRLLVPGTFALTLICLLMGIMGTLTTSASFWFAIVCIFLWAVAYQLTVGAAGFTLSSEVGSLPLRPITQSLVGVTQGLSGWVLGFVTPYMINPDEGNLGVKVGFVFFGLGVITCVLFYFYISETKGLNFDEIDYLFSTNTDPRRFQEKINEFRDRGETLPGKEVDVSLQKNDAVVEHRE